MNVIILKDRRKKVKRKMGEKETVAVPVTPEGKSATIGDLDQKTGENPQEPFGSHNDDEKGVDHSDKK